MDKCVLFTSKTWKDILGMGDIYSVVAVNTHHIKVVYEKLKPNGFQFIKDFPESHYINGVTGMTDLLFSVNYTYISDIEKVMRDKVLEKTENIYPASTVHNKPLSVLHEIMKATTASIKYDGQHGCYMLNDVYDRQVIYMDTPKPWAEVLVSIQDNYRLRLSNNRVNWFNWLKDAAYAPRTDGCVYKFPNGLSVKMDNGKQAIVESGTPIYCETWDATSDITRHNSEADFMVWLTKYF